MAYRAKGRFPGKQKETWITTSWRQTVKEAEDDIKMFGKPHRYKNIRIVKK